MRVLIDECLDWRLGRALEGHFVTSVQRMGWSGISNGQFLKRMEDAKFDVFLSGDRNLQHQQNITRSHISVLVLAAPGTQMIHTLPLMDRVRSALQNIQRGTVMVIR